VAQDRALPATVLQSCGGLIGISLMVTVPMFGLDHWAVPVGVMLAGIGWYLLVHQGLEAAGDEHRREQNAWQA